MNRIFKSLNPIDVLPYANYQAKAESGPRAVTERDMAYESVIDPSLWHPKGKDAYVRDVIENILSTYYGEKPNEDSQWSKLIYNSLEQYMKPDTRDSDSDSYFNPISEISTELFGNSFHLKNNHLLQSFLTQWRRANKISLSDLVGAIRADYNNTHLLN